MTLYKDNMLTLEEAEKLLTEASKLNPGPWVEHSINVAIAAKKITENVKEHDPERAYSLGLIHDLGRRFGVSHLKHVFDGFMFFKEKDQLASEICLSHTFPNKIVEEYQGSFDITEEELYQLKNSLKKIQYGYYHKLIILCDGYGFINGFTSLEKRWIDAAIRLGINELTIDKWKSMYNLRDEINIEYNIDIERLLGVR